MCGFAHVAAMEPCSTASGGTLCDGAGHCVACVTDAQCPTASPNPCKDGVHTAPTACNSGVCEIGEAVDCGKKGMLCKPDGCGPCVNNTDCGPPVEACLDRQCKDGLCETVSLSQASECLLSATGTCDATGMCALRKYVFVTSKTYSPSFGGTKMADATCNQVAEGAKLGGVWSSWTSDSKESTPLDRFKLSAVPYMLLDDKTVVASNWAGLISGMLMHGIHLDEKQQPVVSSPEVWTGTNFGGTYAGSACTDWQFVEGFSLLGFVGIAGDTTVTWTKMKTLACSAQARLYCFQQ